MAELNFLWKSKGGQFQTGESLTINGLYMGGYSWNSFRRVGDKDYDSTQWVGGITLPSLKDTARRVYGAETKEIKAKIEGIVTRWFDKALAKAEGK